MISMLPLCNYCPIYSGMIPAFIPMMSVPFTPFNNMNMWLSTTITDEYEFDLNSRFRHVKQDHRHAPFDWYQPPKQYHKIVHDDAAVVTPDGPIPVADFYHFRIYYDEE